MSSKDPLSKIRAGDVYKNLVRVMKEFGVPDSDWSVVDRRPHPELTVRYCGQERRMHFAGTPSSRFSCRHSSAELRRLLKEMQMASLGAAVGTAPVIRPVEPDALSPSILISDGRVVVTSVEVAERFGRRHDDVRRAFANIECSDGFLSRNFAEKDIATGGRPMKVVEMTRDGFTMLAMGFTGAAAMAWRERFIEAFNRMEAELAAVHAAPALASLPSEVRREFGGIVKAVIHRELAEILPQMVEQRLLSGPAAVVNMVPALTVIQWAGVNDRRGLRGLSVIVSNALRRFHADRGIAVQIASLASESRYVFDPAASRRWLDEGGRRMIQIRVAEKQGQLRLAVA